MSPHIHKVFSKHLLLRYSVLSVLLLLPLCLHADGKTIAFDRSKGNCLACHVLADGESPGNIGPALENMQQKYPDINILRDRIWDETKYNPYTVMPPFGKHQILSEEEIDQVVEYIYTL